MPFYFVYSFARKNRRMEAWERKLDVPDSPAKEGGFVKNSGKCLGAILEDNSALLEAAFPMNLSKEQVKVLAERAKDLGYPRFVGAEARMIREKDGQQEPKREDEK